MIFFAENISILNSERSVMDADEFAAFSYYPVPTSCSGLLLHQCTVLRLTCEPAGLGQQEGAPGHEEEERRFQQREAVQLCELGDVEVQCKAQQHFASLQITIRL